MTLLSRGEARLLKIVMNILSKRPWEFGVVLDQGGWLDFKTLYKVLREEGIGPSSHKGLIRFFEVYRPPDIEIEPGRLRSTNRSFQYSELLEASYPEGTLYYGIRKKALHHVRKHGLDSTKRRLVLSETKEMAERIVKRLTGNYLLIEVDSVMAQARGARFQSLGGVLYTCPFLHPKWLRLPMIEEEIEGEEDKKEEPRVQKVRESELEKGQKSPPGSFFLNIDPSDVAYLEEKSGRRRDRWGKRHKKGKRRK